MMQEIIKEGVRIFRPSEYEQLRKTLKPEQQLVLDGLLLTGMRYTEATALLGHSEWLEGQFIKTQSKKAKTKFKERWIRLSDMGRLILPNFIKVAKLSSRQAFDETLKRWASNANLTPMGVCCKTFRKTWESWLVSSYPTHQIEIAQSQGHDKVTQAEHYLNLPFDSNDKRDMEKWIRGYV